MTTVNTLFSGGQGVAVPSGFNSNSILYQAYQQNIAVSSSVYTNLSFASGVSFVTIQQGTWSFKLTVVEGPGVNLLMRIGLSTDSSTGFSDLSLSYNASDIPGATSSYNATNNVFFTTNLTSATTYYAKANVATSTTKNWIVTFQAIRLA